MASALQQFLMGRRGHKGGTAGGRPYLTGHVDYGRGHPAMQNLSDDQLNAAHTLSATLAAGGPKMASDVKQHLTDVQQQRLEARNQALAAGGFAPGTHVYGPGADPAALAFLQGGTGLGRGIGLAQAAPRHPGHAMSQGDPAGLAGLLRAVGRNRRRRGGYGGAGGSG